MIGKRLGKYVIEDTIGAGAMSTVYRARHVKNGRIVAIKVLHEHLSKGEAKNRFAREARVLAGLNSDKCIKIIETLQQDGKLFYVVLEYVDGQSLSSVLKKKGVFPPMLALFTIREILDALIAAHSEGIVHRDLKPENIFVNKKGEIKVGDFGLARLTGATGLTKPGTLIGSPAFMSPEQVLGRTADERSDIFSLALIHYNLLTGSLLFNGSNKTEIFRNILDENPAPKLKALNIDDEYREILSKALAKERKKRFKSSADLAHVIDSYLSQRGLDRYGSVLREYLSSDVKIKNEDHLLAKCLLIKGAVMLDKGADATTAKHVMKRGLVLLGEKTGNLEQKIIQKNASHAKQRVNIPSILIAFTAGVLTAAVASVFLKIHPVLYKGESHTSQAVIQSDHNKKDDSNKSVSGSKVSHSTKNAEIEKNVHPKEEKTSEKSEATYVENEVALSPSKSSSLPDITPFINKGSKTSDRETPSKHVKKQKKKTKDTALRTAEPVSKKKVKIRINTVPWAKIFVDGKLAGETPLLDEFTLSTGKHTIKAENPMCRPIEKILNISAEKPISLNWSLKLKPAHLHLSGPKGTAFFMDGKPLNAAVGSTIEVEPGFHDIGAAPPKGATQVKRIEVPAGSTVKVISTSLGLKIVTIPPDSK